MMASEELIKELLVTGESVERTVTGELIKRSITGFYVPIAFPGCSGMDSWERHFIYTGNYIYYAMKPGEHESFLIDDPSTIRKATEEEVEAFYSDSIRKDMR